MHPYLSPDPKSAFPRGMPGTIHDMTPLSTTRVYRVPENADQDGEPDSKNGQCHKVTGYPSRKQHVPHRGSVCLFGF